MSSRNVLLSSSDRPRAAALHRSLESIRQAIAAGERDASAVRERALAELNAAGLEPDYLELVTAHGLMPVQRIEDEVLALVAVRVGDTRLIDNELIHANGRT